MRNTRSDRTCSDAVSDCCSGLRGGAGDRLSLAELRLLRGVGRYLKSKGFDATVISTDDLGAVKEKMHVPADMQSCHTALIGGYVVEGHVPVEAIAKLLAEKPQVTGIAVPEMPGGSPGMSGPKESFTAYAFGPQGKTVFMRFLNDPRRCAERMPGTANATTSLKEFSHDVDHIRQMERNEQDRVPGLRPHRRDAHHL